MLEKLPAGLGHALARVRPGLQELAVNRRDISSTAEAPLSVTSAAFANGGTIPTRYTADGDRLSPPLEWSGVPDGAAAAVLLIEDADSPTPHPLVHAIVYDLAPDANRLDEGALPGPAGDRKSTRLNSSHPSISYAVFCL